jgi:hypothetical protein
MLYLLTPDIAALVSPLYASVKRGFYRCVSLPSFRQRRREGGPAKPRPGELTMRDAFK